MTNNMIYLASPMKSTADIKKNVDCPQKFKRNAEIADKLKSAGLDIFLPQENQAATDEETLKKELEVIRQSEFMIILLSDTRGIYLEAGYAKALGKKIYAIKLPESRELSGWGKCWYDYIAEDVDDLINYLKH